MEIAKIVAENIEFNWIKANNIGGIEAITEPNLRGYNLKEKQNPP